MEMEDNPEEPSPELLSSPAGVSSDNGAAASKTASMNCGDGERARTPDSSSSGRDSEMMDEELDRPVSQAKRRWSGPGSHPDLAVCCIGSSAGQLATASTCTCAAVFPGREYLPDERGPHFSCAKWTKPAFVQDSEPYEGKIPKYTFTTDPFGCVLSSQSVSLGREFDYRSLWDPNRLRGGLKFSGEQRSNGSVFTVSVDLKDVDFDAGLCSGFMTVKGISDEIQDLRTFFTGEIIGKHFRFQTRQWGATDAIDRKHWRKFKQFDPYSKGFNQDAIDYSKISYEDCVFMRWKEKFTLEDHKQEFVRGASFSGFYYVCYDCHDASISGFYYYRNTDWFQSLHLAREPMEEGPHRTYQFR